MPAWHVGRGGYVMYDNIFKVYASVAKSNTPKSCETIAKETGLCVRTVQRITQVWLKRGFFGVMRPKDSNCYLYYAFDIKKP